MSMFQKATKRAIRARVALDGPSGAGKTWTALEWARKLGDRTAVVDTERGSASLYSDHFDFDVLEMSPPFHPDRLIAAIKDAEKAGYDTLIADSLSHYWEGEGGVLDIADAAGSRAAGNSWAGWKTASPVLRHLIDTILAADLHLIVTMRSKQEWVLEETVNKQGKSVQSPKRVGMAPVMRAGMEYEFTLVGELDLEHRMTITKSRCDVLADKVIQPGRAGEAAELFVNWTKSGAEIASRNDIDALKTAMNRLEPPEVRLACKRAFSDAFGNPEFLIASKIGEARALISGYGPTTDPGADIPPSAPDADGSSDCPSPGPSAAPSTPQPVEQPAEPSGPTAAQQKKWAKDIHIHATNSKVSDVDLDLIILNATNLRTQSAGELDGSEATGVINTVTAAGQNPNYMERIRAAVAEAYENPAGNERSKEAAGS